MLIFFSENQIICSSSLTRIIFFPNYNNIYIEIKIEEPKSTIIWKTKILSIFLCVQKATFWRNLLSVILNVVQIITTEMLKSESKKETTIFVRNVEFQIFSFEGWVQLSEAILFLRIQILHWILLAQTNCSTKLQKN